MTDLEKLEVVLLHMKDEDFDAIYQYLIRQAEQPDIVITTKHDKAMYNHRLGMRDAANSLNSIRRRVITFGLGDDDG